MKNIVNVEFIVKMDKAIYEASPRKTREEFFNTLVIDCVDTDLNFHKRESEKMKSPLKENYKVFIKTLEGMRQSINKSIKYELMNTNNNTEEIKVNFSFKYYETPTISIERMVDAFIFLTSTQDNRADAERLEKIKSIPGKIPEEKKEEVDNAIKMFHHAADFMDEGKSTLIILKDGVKLEPKKEKLKI